MRCLIIALTLLFLGCSTGGRLLQPQTIRPEWEEAAPGVWKTRIHEPDPVDLLNTAGIKPDQGALEKLGKTPFPLEEAEIEAVLVRGKTFLRFPLEKSERIYGLGLHFKTVDQRGRILRLHVDHYGGKDNGRTHAPVPFFVSSAGYGVLINAASYIDIYVGTAVRRDSPEHPAPRDRNTDPNWSAAPESDGIEVLIPAQGAEVLVFGGPDPLSAVQRYNLYCGGGCLPPKWGLGFWHRTPTLYTEEQVRSEAAEFERKCFPLDVIGLEPGWQSRSYPCTYEWDEGRFPDPKAFMQEMRDEGIRLNLWINPYVSPEASIYESIKPFTGSHTVWLGPVPDYSMSGARKILMKHFETALLSLGVSGFKIDESDGYDRWLWPDTAVFPSGLTGERLRQVYGLLLQRMTFELYRERNIRTYGLTRASNAGASSYPYVIYNDSYSHREFITALINSGFCGVLWTPEVRSSQSGEEWLRRMQSVCFSPMAMVNAWASGTKPWSFPEVYDSAREVAMLRMRLLPYLYSAFAQYRFEGIPPFRAMCLEEGFLEEKTGLKDQYMMGDVLLVAPMFAGEKSRKVALPSGKWYDFYTGEYAGAGEVIIVKPGLDKIPLFVKDGGIIPMMPAVLRTKDMGKEIPLEVCHYGEAEGSFMLYDDDGETFDYEEGVYSWMELKVSKNQDGHLEGSVESKASNYSTAYKVKEWNYR